MSVAAGVPVLDERPICFDYGYWMICDCGRASHISAEDYHVRSCVDALMPCDHCDGVIHFGPAVAALTDQNDPALDNARISQLAWYHTSTSPDWPSATYAESQRAQLLAQAKRFRIGEAAIERQITQALHVGTYEAAIENMLRRMRNQNDALSQFYLHRVGLRTDPLRVNDGYRDENHDEAAQLATQDLREAGLMAVRYLNVWEHRGSLSLAVLPETIVSVQTVSLPVTSAALPHGRSLLSQLHQWQVQLDQLHASAPDTSAIDPIQLRMMQLLASREPDGIGAASSRYEEACTSLWNSVTEALNAHHLAGVSPVVADQFQQAVGAQHRRRPTAVLEFADAFAAAAAVLSRPAVVTALLASDAPGPAV